MGEVAYNHPHLCIRLSRHSAEHLITPTASRPGWNDRVSLVQEVLFRRDRVRYGGSPAGLPAPSHALTKSFQETHV